MHAHIMFSKAIKHASWCSLHQYRAIYVFHVNYEVFTHIAIMAHGEWK
jgi:hypothetical protein